MLSRHVHYATFVAIVFMASSAAAQPDLAAYREFRLGASTADVITRGRAAARDVKTLHERPALLQELSWRAPYVIGGDSTERDSVATILFSFVNDQLFRMTINYERSRTEGLTKDDLIESLSAVYGPRSTRPSPPTPRPAFDSLDRWTILASWDQDETTIALTQSTYSDGFGLVIMSVPLEALARKAQATALIMDAREAPAREAARAKAQADAEQAAAEKTRTANKATFKP